MTQLGHRDSVFIDEAEIDTIEMQLPADVRALQPTLDSTDEFELIDRSAPESDDTAATASHLSLVPAAPAEGNEPPAAAVDDVPGNSRWHWVVLSGVAVFAAALAWLWSINSFPAKDSSALAPESASTPLAAPAPESASASMLIAPTKPEPISTPISSSPVKRPPPPKGKVVKFQNPFDATEVFEFPAGTSATEAREAVTELLLRRARERVSQRRSRGG